MERNVLVEPIVSKAKVFTSTQRNRDFTTKLQALDVERDRRCGDDNEEDFLVVIGVRESRRDK